MDFNRIYEKLFLKAKGGKQENLNENEFPAPTVMMLGAPTPSQGLFGGTDKDSFPKSTVVMPPPMTYEEFLKHSSEAY